MQTGDYRLSPISIYFQLIFINESVLCNPPAFPNISIPDFRPLIIRSKLDLAIGFRRSVEIGGLFYF